MPTDPAETIVHGLYEAAATLGDDRPVLDTLRDWIDAEHVVISEEGPARIARTCSHLDGVSLVGQSLGRSELSRLFQVAVPEGAMFRQSDYVDIAELRRSPTYRQLLAQHNGGLSASAYWTANGSFNAFYLCRSLRAVHDFSDQDLARLRTLLPHVKATQLIRQNLRRANQVAAAAGLALGNQQQALFLLDPAGNLAYRNDPADELLAGGDGFCLTSRGLSCNTAIASARLAAAVSAMQRLARLPLADAVAHSASGSFSLPRPGGPPLRVTVLPVTGLALFTNAALDPGWVAILVDETRQSAGELGKRLSAFGLTPRETQLVAALVAGQPLPVAATTLGVTHETARQYLKSVFGKTGVNRQAELIRLASRSAG